MICIIVCQVMGAFGGLALGFLVRTTIPRTDDPTKYLYVPDQNPFYPRVLDKVGTVPAYGQVLFAETLGTLLYVFVQLHVKHGFRGQEPIREGEEIKTQSETEGNQVVDDFERRDPSISAIMIGLAYYAMIYTFREISAGPLNPAIVIAQIMWQTTTFSYQPGFDWNHWTGEYATMYLMGPILGGMIAANFYNYLKQVEFRLPKEKDLLFDSNITGRSSMKTPTVEEEDRLIAGVSGKKQKAAISEDEESD